jgi:hypothetical protein
MLPTLRDPWRIGRGQVGFLFTGNSLIERNRDIQMVKVGVNYRFNWSGYGYGYR